MGVANRKENWVCFLSIINLNLLQTYQNGTTFSKRNDENIGRRIVLKPNIILRELMAMAALNQITELLHKYETLQMSKYFQNM